MKFQNNSIHNNICPSANNIKNRQRHNWTINNINHIIRISKLSILWNNQFDLKEIAKIIVNNLIWERSRRFRDRKGDHDHDHPHLYLLHLRIYQ